MRSEKWSRAALCRDAIRATIGSVRARCARVTESTRLVAMESSNLERVVSSAGMTLPNGMTLPPGTAVAVNRAAMLRREDVFGAEPFAFDPTRWLKQEDESEQAFTARRAKMDHAMIPFGTGTSLEGHVNAPQGGISLDLSRMDRVLQINAEDLDCTVEPGITREALFALVDRWTCSVIVHRKMRSPQPV